MQGKRFTERLKEERGNIISEVAFGLVAVLLLELSMVLLSIKIKLEFKSVKKLIQAVFFTDIIFVLLMIIASVTIVYILWKFDFNSNLMASYC